MQDLTPGTFLAWGTVEPGSWFAWTAHTTVQQGRVIPGDKTTFKDGFQVQHFGLEAVFRVVVIRWDYLIDLPTYNDGQGNVDWRADSFASIHRCTVSLKGASIRGTGGASPGTDTSNCVTTGREPTIMAPK